MLRFLAAPTERAAGGDVVSAGHVLEWIDRAGYACAPGRYDLSGPLDTGWHLHRAWPASRPVVLEDAGHGGAGFTDALVHAIDIRDVS